MGKLSALNQETAFSLSDFLLKIKNGGTGDVIVTLQNFLNATGGKAYYPYKFFAYLTAAQATGTGGFFLMNIDTIVYDTGNNFSTSTHLFTAPVAGYYIFNASWQCISQAGNPKLTSLAKNSSTTEYIRLQEIPNTTGNITISGISPPLLLAANDTIGFLGYSTEAKNVNNNFTTTYFGGYLLSAT